MKKKDENYEDLSLTSEEKRTWKYLLKNKEGTIKDLKAHVGEEIFQELYNMKFIKLGKSINHGTIYYLTEDAIFLHSLRIKPNFFKRLDSWIEYYILR